MSTKYLEAQDQIVAMLGAGRPLRAIEDEVIDCAPLAPDERAALWLYAWGLESRRERRFQRRRASRGTEVAQVRPF